MSDLREFDLSSLQEMMNAPKVATNQDGCERLKMPIDTKSNDMVFFRKIKNECHKQMVDSHHFVIGKSVLFFINEQSSPVGDVIYKNTKAKEYLALPFDSIWIEGGIDYDSGARLPIFGVNGPKGDNNYMQYFGLQITEHDNYYYISALMTPLIENGNHGHSEEKIHYTCIIKHEAIENDDFRTNDERNFYIQIHSIIDLVTRHKKLAYIHHNKSKKMQTPKGVKKIHVNTVIKICLKEEGVKMINRLGCKNLEYSHRFPVMGHWRYYPNREGFEGYDKKGNKNQMGRTWITDYEKQKDKKKKKGQIRYVNEVSRTHGKMDEVA